VTQKDREAFIMTGLRGAAKVRSGMQLSRIAPICIYDVCDRRKQEVFFIKGGSFEGLYCATNNTIAICSERPQGRQSFTCAHELGHAVFNHGTRADLIGDFDRDRSDDPEELIADAFAGHLLMPPHAVESEIDRRSWKAGDLTALQVYGLACQFGVGYRTIITHLSCALNLVSLCQAEQLRKTSPQNIRSMLFPGFTGRHLAFVDKFWNSSVTVDVAVGDALFFPSGVRWQGDRLKPSKETSSANCFVAVSPGLCITTPESNQSLGVRVRRADYVGKSSFRHLEEED
jgi:IrrE N-terminal-like domain